MMVTKMVMMMVMTAAAADAAAAAAAAAVVTVRPFASELAAGGGVVFTHGSVTEEFGDFSVRSYSPLQINLNSGEPPALHSSMSLLLLLVNSILGCLK